MSTLKVEAIKNPASATDTLVLNADGTLNIEGVRAVTPSSTSTLTNKTLTAPVLTGSVTSSGNPSLNIGSGALTAGTGTFTVSGITYGTVVNNTSNAQNYNALAMYQRQGANKVALVLDSNDNLGIYHFGLNGVVSTFSSTGLAVTGSMTIGSFTTATRPAHAAGKMIYVSDGGAGAVFQGSNGSSWVNLG